MPLSGGTRLGPYEILAPVGAGGMGEVYRARDTRLDRTVAVKVLPGHLSASEEVRQRFEREAKTISQLSHPHVCALYDVGNQDGVEYLVMEYLEGETLAQRLVKGPLPLDQTLRFGMEIADALDKAHRHGIVHRDLKPGNVMITKSGVKLLDFGLAKAAAPPASQAGVTSLPTIIGSSPLTHEGTILGTFQYMAPEQLEGKEADARSDIFAFGAVLYEMATGRKAFTGASQASLIGAILHTEPQPISAVHPMSPPALDRIVKTCLAKDPEERFQTAHDAGLQLRWIAEGGSASGIPAPAAARRSGRKMLAASLAGFVIGGALAAVAVRAFLMPAPAPRQPWRFELLTDAATPLLSAPWSPLALSPDGRMIAAALSEAGSWRLYLHRFEKAGWTPIAGTEAATAPVFSPDGRWIAFQAGGKIRKAPVSGGNALIVCEGGTSYGITWGADNTIWFGTSQGIVRVPATGGKPEIAVPVESGELSLRRPQILPGGKAMIFAALTTGTPPTRIEAVSLESGRRKKLVEGGYQPLYSAATGHLIYLPTQLGGVAIAVPFDARRLEITGPPVGMTDEPMTTLVVSDNGTLAYIAAIGAQINSMAWVDRSGKIQALPAPPHVFEQPRISPDGKSVAVSSREGDPDVWIYSLERGTLLRFTNDPDEDETPIWSPDGKSVAFRRERKILMKPADGSAAEEMLATSTSNWHLGSFAPDGRSLVLYALGTTGEDIFRLSIDSKASLTPFLQTQANEKAPALSPDGKWIAYCSDESGREEIYVQAYPGPGGKVQISTDSGNEPAWARNGRELFYRNSNRMMAVNVTTEPSFSASAPRLLFEGRFTRGHRGYTNYDVSRDGTRFLMIQGQESASTPIHVVLDWASELGPHGSVR